MANLLPQTRALSVHLWADTEGPILAGPQLAAATARWLERFGQQDPAEAVFSLVSYAQALGSQDGAAPRRVLLDEVARFLAARKLPADWLEVALRCTGDEPPGTPRAEDRFD